MEYCNRYFSSLSGQRSFVWTYKYFEKWGKAESIAGQRRINDVCEQIANYSAYAFTIKYKDDWKKNAHILIKDKRIKKYFSMYSNIKKSRFMMLFSLGIKLGSPRILYEVSKLMRSRISEWLLVYEKKSNS